MKKPTLKILKGRKGLNDWLDISLKICNHLDIYLSAFGFGIHFNWIIKDSVRELVNNLDSPEATQ